MQLVEFEVLGIPETSWRHERPHSSATKTASCGVLWIHLSFAIWLQRRVMTSLTGNWLANSLICVTLYGFWGFLGKLALVQGLSASQQATVEKLGFFMLLPLIMKPSSNDPQGKLSAMPKMAIPSAWLSGASAAIASMFYSRALAHGDAGAVSAITASYPPLTFLLGAAGGTEQLNRRKFLASLFTVIGAALFAKS